MAVQVVAGIIGGSLGLLWRLKRRHVQAYLKARWRPWLRSD